MPHLVYRASRYILYETCCPDTVTLPSFCSVSTICATSSSFNFNDSDLIVDNSVFNRRGRELPRAARLAMTLCTAGAITAGAIGAALGSSLILAAGAGTLAAT